MNDDQQRTTAIRSDAVAISYETRKGLRYVARAMGLPNTDALAEQVLSDWLHDKHALVTAYIEDCSVTEGKFERELKDKINPKPF